jgi:hypothetical protein
LGRASCGFSSALDSPSPPSLLSLPRSLLRPGGFCRGVSVRPGGIDGGWDPIVSERRSNPRIPREGTRELRPERIGEPWQSPAQSDPARSRSQLRRGNARCHAIRHRTRRRNRWGSRCGVRCPPLAPPPSPCSSSSPPYHPIQPISLVPRQGKGVNKKNTRPSLPLRFFLFLRLVRSMGCWALLRAIGGGPRERQPGGLGREIPSATHGIPSGAWRPQTRDDDGASDRRPKQAASRPGSRPDLHGGVGGAIDSRARSQLTRGR